MVLLLLGGTEQDLSYLIETAAAYAFDIRRRRTLLRGVIRHSRCPCYRSPTALA